MAPGAATEHYYILTTEPIFAMNALTYILYCILRLILVYFYFSKSLNALLILFVHVIRIFSIEELQLLLKTALLQLDITLYVCNSDVFEGLHFYTVDQLCFLFESPVVTLLLALVLFPTSSSEIYLAFKYILPCLPCSQ